MKRSSRKAKNRRQFRGSQARLESLEARMVMDATGYEDALDSFMGTDRVGKDGPLAVLGWNLTLLYHDTITGGGSGVGTGVDDPDAADGTSGSVVSAEIRDPFLIDSNDRVLLDLAPTNAAAKSLLKTSLSQIGFTQTGEYGNTVSGWLPITSLADLAAIPALGGVSPSIVSTSVGSVDSQGDASMFTDTVRAEYGFDGTGVKIGVLSDSYDALGGAALDVSTGDLPGIGNPLGNTTPVQVLQDYITSSSTDEGRGMLQLVHDVAPGAELAFTTAFTGKAGFAQGIYNLAAAGANVIVDDVGYASEPWFSDGMIARAADAVVQNNVAYFTSAGNSARESYEAPFVASENVYYPGQIGRVAGAPFFFGGTAYDFDPSETGVDDRQSVTIPALSIAVIAFQWDDNFFTENGLSAYSDLDIYLLVNNRVVAGGVDINVDGFEFFGVINSGLTDVNAEIMILAQNGEFPTRIKYNIFSGNMVINEYATDSGTAVGHSNAAYAMSVGAAYYVDTPEFGTSPPQLESFSSAGGTPILIDQNGLRIDPVIRQNVDIVAPDGTDTTFFGFDVDLNGFPNFFGTSAAAPHAAALAALMRQANPSLTALEINDIMRDTAIDMDDPATAGYDSGYDFGTGYGYVNGLEAVLTALFAGGDTIGSSDTCGVYTGPPAIQIHAGLGANLFVTGHSVLDNGVDNGQLGYDYEILNFLRGKGTSQEIAADQYSIAIIGNDTASWGFSSGSQYAVGYQSTTFYDIDNITSSVWTQILSNDALIILSDINAVPTDGLDDLQIDSIVAAKSLIAAAVNTRGLDVWAGGGSIGTGYYDFLPTGAVTAADLAASATLYAPTAEGQALGFTATMANAAESYSSFINYDDNFFLTERRDFGEDISLAATNVAFSNDELVTANAETDILMHGVIGYKFNDINLDGVRQANEPGLAGFTFFIDENGDGKIGLCEPAAVTDASGKFTLYPRQSGTFNILQVIEPGYYNTDPITHTIEVNGTRITINASLDSGAIPAVDYGDAGLPYAAAPVVDGLQLGDSPFEDDGVVFGSGLKIGTNTVTIDSSTVISTALLQAWMDFNKDGDFNDPGEQIFKNLQLQSGIHTYTFTIPNTVIDDSSLPDAYRIPLNARFRLDYQQNLGPTGAGFAGEVEDYQVYIKGDPESGLFLKDDVFTYLEDTPDQTYDVLANDKTFFNRTITLTGFSSQTAGAPDSAFSIVGNKLVFDATGITGLTEDIVVEYTAMDSAGFTETATLTLRLPGAGALSIFSTSFINQTNSGDVNGDGVLSSHDLTILLYELDHQGARTLPVLGSPGAGFNKYIDVNGDGAFNVLDYASLLGKMIQQKLNREGEAEGEAVDAAFAVEDSISETITPAPILDPSPTTQSSTLTSSNAATTSSSSSDVSFYLAGVLEKPNGQSSLLSQDSESSVDETLVEGEMVDYLYPDSSTEYLLIDSSSSSTLMTEEVESAIDEIAIDVDAAWEEDLISG
ncbi:GEVED domain-containing protein [Blastopirellula sp. JC732]|uniref:GEVED domain-containing protein n=1 Tax=Blastopirellula sediminis TaxID=2894196 RepID=A0A9X1SIA9_9BACT|nr:GEVED domain-containing protein [Blastopirellula sediminis]MCC9604606.1 GEVED domain-containing protein [Blastopirellula sediminis]MCC9632095.1 GEVED domain-containing protein [Blastopirellula sediminis]